MNKYRVKVVELHEDIVEVFAESKEEAESKALEVAECTYSVPYSSEVIETE